MFDLIELLVGNLEMTGSIDECRAALNPDLAAAEVPHELLADGRIVPLLTEEQRALVADPVPTAFPDKTRTEVENARELFTARGATTANRKAAIQLLYAAFEKERELLKVQLLKDDEALLFQLANKFAIRHNGENQHPNFDEGIWYEWIFYVYMATILTLGRIIERDGAAAPEPSPS